MANIFPSEVVALPHYMDPGLIVQYNQASGAFDLLPDRKPEVRLGEGDLYAYQKVMGIRTNSASGQSAYNQLPSCTVDIKLISTPTYLLRTRAEYDHHDTAAGGRWGVSIPEAQRLGGRQSIFQQQRNALLYGFNPTAGEGLVNTNGATAINLPADTFGNQTVVTYDNGQMAFFLLSQVLLLKQQMYQLGMPSPVVVIGPQRVLGQFEYPDIVQLVQFQRPGAGSESTKGVFETVAEQNGDTIIWNYDDTLIGQGQNGHDLVIMVIPKIDRPTAADPNTNEFAKITPGNNDVTRMFIDMAAPREIPTPLAGGAIDILMELRTTSGWGVRPEGINLISMQYS